MCVCVCVCVCYQQNSKTNYSRKTKLGILNGHDEGMLLETFCKDRSHSPYTGIHKIIQVHYGLWEEILVISITQKQMIVGKPNLVF